MTAAGTPSTARPMDGPLLSRLYQMGIVKRDGEINVENMRLACGIPCRRKTSAKRIGPTVARALDRYEAAHARLPMLEHALLIIDEHCEIDARRVYDQDNKGWKAIANAIKGRLIPDDDQYSLGVCLLSRRLPQNVCHIYLIPEQDAGDFLTLRAENYLPFSLTSGYNYGSIPK